MRAASAVQAVALEATGGLAIRAEQVFAELVYSYVMRQDLFAQNSADTLGIGLRPGRRGKCAAG